MLAKVSNSSSSAAALLQDVGERGPITTMGSRLVRWAVPEDIACHHGGTRLQHDFHRIADRRGKNKAPRRRGPQVAHARGKPP